MNGLYKNELTYRRGPWKTMEQVEVATGAWVSWWNEQRLHEACRYVPPAEFEEIYYGRRDRAGSAAEVLSAEPPPKPVRFTSVLVVMVG
ncbi:MAG: integrase core domain-containing protein [Acidimicrobiales bacterium]